MRLLKAFGLAILTVTVLVAIAAGLICLIDLAGDPGKIVSIVVGGFILIGLFTIAFFEAIK